ncbi:MAG: hypothetical protein ACXVI7_10715 [Halobacteriota archaeon]
MSASCCGTSGNGWYETASATDPLMQGDLIQKCPVIELVQPKSQPNPRKIGDQLEGRQINYDVVVLSQSCDLAQKKTKFVVLCPYWPLSAFQKTREQYKEEELLTDLISQNVHGYHVLNKCDYHGFPPEILVVSFRHITSLPYKWLVQFTKGRGERPRLTSPYREHLSQSFARFFMRVGLPEDIKLEDSWFIKRSCTNCGTRSLKDANYCSYCGEPINK